MQTSVNSAKVAPVKSSVQSNIEFTNHKIANFTIQRSLSSNRLFTVIAVDKKGNFITVVSPDLQFDVAASIVDDLNSELQKGE